MHIPRFLALVMPLDSVPALGAFGQSPATTVLPQARSRFTKLDHSCLLVILLATSCAAAFGQASVTNPTQATSSGASGKVSASAPAPIDLKLDTTTGEIMAPGMKSDDLAALNAPEKRRARLEAILAVTEPGEQQRLIRLKKTAAQLKVEEDALWAVMHPAEHAAAERPKKAPEQIKQEQAILASVLAPEQPKKAGVEKEPKGQSSATSSAKP